MGEINLSREEQVALEALDLAEIDRMIEKAAQYETAIGLQTALWRLGPFISQKLHFFETALEAHRKAKAARKREQTAYDVHKGASDLKWAVREMRDRMEIERKNGELFYIEDDIFWPRAFSPNLKVRIAYRWRRTVEDDWRHSAITFTHLVNSSQNYLLPQPRRKLSQAKQNEALQEALSRNWEHLKRLGLYSVREYFQAGRDGSEIPETFKAVTDSYSRGLNNFSCDFWERHERLLTGER